MRVTFTDTTQNVVPYAKLYWSGITDQTKDDSTVMTLTSAPSGSATVGLYEGEKNSAAATVYTGGATLGASSTAYIDSIGSEDVNGDGVDDSFIYIAANASGRYVGSLQNYDGAANGTKVNFSFTTTGAPAGLTLTVGKPSVPLSTPVAGIATLDVKDAAGNATQIQYVDGVAMTTSEAGAAFTGAGPDDTAISGTLLYAGTYDVGLRTAALPGSFTLTATPTGTPWGSAQTGTYTVINNVSPTALLLVDSSSTLNVKTASAVSATGNGIASPGTTTLAYGVAVAAANAGKPVVLAVGGTAWTALGLTEPGSVVVTTNASGEGSFTVTVPAASAATPGRQIDVTGAVVGQYRTTITTGAVYCDTTSRTPSAGTIALPTGTTQPVTFTVDDSYGVPKAGYVVTATATGATTQTGVTGADGKVTLDLPAPSNSSQTSAAWTFAISGVPAGALGACKALTVQFSASGNVTIATPTINGASATNYTGVGSATTPAVVPYGGYIRANGVATAADGKQVKLGATVGVGNVNVELSAPAGVWFCADDDTYQLGTTAFGDDCAESTFTETAVGTALSVYVQATKVGTHTITATTTSGATLSWDVTFSSADAAARNVTLSADPAKVSVGRTSSVTAEITDVFGNPVAMAAGGAKVTLVTDFGTLAGGTNIFEIDVTPASGKAVVSLAASTAGIATVSAAGSGGQFGNLADVPYTGAAKSVDKAAAPVEFTSAPTEKSIVIAGSRTTVSGKPGIIIDGSTTGIEDGKTVIPYFRFPGQTEYTQGSARPVVNGDEFTWQRKTGKKFYAYVTNDDGEVKSNRVIIQAK